MKRIAVFNVKNQDTLHNTVLTLGSMNVTNTVISSWNATQNTSFWNTSNTSHDTQGSPCQIELKTPLGRLRKMKLVQITVPLLKTLQLESLKFTQRLL